MQRPADSVAQREAGRPSTQRPLVSALAAVKRSAVRSVPYGLKLAMKRLAFLGRGRYCEVCESPVRRFREFGDPPRPNACCPVCLSVERHRLVWRFLNERTDLFDGRPKRMLHFAPERALARRLRKAKNLDYVSADLRDTSAMVKADITELQFAEHSFDVIYCSHVLEHVADDRAALSELRRVQAVGGWTVLLVPITTDKTFEDPSVTDPDERRHLFGQHDHVRRYGPDFEDRLVEAGFLVRRYSADELVPAEKSEYLGIVRGESVFYCTLPAADPEGPGCSAGGPQSEAG